MLYLAKHTAANLNAMLAQKLKSEWTLTAQWVDPLPARLAPRNEASTVSAHLFSHE